MHTHSRITCLSGVYHHNPTRTRAHPPAKLVALSCAVLSQAQLVSRHGSTAACRKFMASEGAIRQKSEVQLAWPRLLVAFTAGAAVTVAGVSHPAVKSSSSRGANAGSGAGTGAGGAGLGMAG